MTENLPAAAGASTGLVITNDQTEFTPAQLSALKQLGIEDAPQGDLDVFFHQAKRTGLDPFAKQIYMIGRKTKTGGYRGEPERWETKWTIQIGIDGFRLTGQRLAEAQGLDRPVPSRQFCGHDGQWTEVWLGDGPPAAAKGIITIGGLRYEATVLFREYAQTRNTQDGGKALTGQWATKPATMLGKCAEAAAWRAAFPADFSGLYEAAEMDRHATVDGEVVDTPALASRPASEKRGVGAVKERLAARSKQQTVAAPTAPASDDTAADDQPTASDDIEASASAAAERARLWRLMQAEGLDDAKDALEWLSIQVKRDLTSTKDLTPDEVTDIADFLETPDEPKDSDQ